MIDIATEHLLTLPQAAEWIGERSAKKPRVMTLRHWVWHGIGNPAVRLESIKIGGYVYTSQEAIQRFVRQQGEPSAPPAFHASLTPTRVPRLTADDVRKMLGGDNRRKAT